MARIRTIKPEYWTDDRVGECSPSARLLFIACWNFADDQRGLNRSAKQLKAQAFPYDVIDCEELVQQLIRAGLLIEYQVASKKYLHIKNFLVHQKIDNPAKARIPPYDESMNNGEDSPSPHLVLAPSSLEGKVREGKGEKKEGAAAPLSLPLGLDLQAWDRWETYRKQLKKPIRSISREPAMREMAALGERQAEAVEYTIAKGWQGLRAPDLPRGSPQKNGADTHTDSDGIPTWATPEERAEILRERGEHARA